MSSSPRITLWLSCIACGMLAGCCATHKSRAACSHCAPAQVVSEVPSTYENYTPPQPALIPMPAPAAELPQEVPPPPATRNDTNKVIDYFESANGSRASGLNR